jgi:hypothetical protein
MDFAWVAQDDSNAIQNAIVDAKGDLIAASAADTPARLAVGNNGETLVADSSATTGLRYQVGNGLAQGAINGGMDIWQRGTSFTQTSYQSPGYTADRWRIVADVAITVSRESTIVPEGFQYSTKIVGNGSNTPTPFLNQVVETSNAILYAGKTVTLSAYQYASSSLATKVVLYYSTAVDEGQAGGGWVAITPSSGGFQTANNSWTRISGVFAVPSTAKSLLIQVVTNATITGSQAWYVTGVQLEVGSVATNFRRAGGTIQGELSACQRYFETYLFGGDGIVSAQAISTSAAYGGLSYKVKKRGTPTIALSSGTFYVWNASATSISATFQADAITVDTARIAAVSASGLVAGNAANLYFQNLTISISAEL